MTDVQRDGGEAGSLLYLSRVCLVATLGGLLFGYDTAVISGAIGFLRLHFDLTAAQEGWAASCALAGCAVGAALAGVVSDHLGRKKMLVVSAVLFTISALGTALPRTLFEFVIYRFVGGLGIGAASMTSPMYIAEITPARIRGRMVSWNQFAIILGMLLVYFVNYFIAGWGDETWNVSSGWRWMFASGTLPAVLLFVLLFTVPESPRWLTERGRTDEALAVLARVNDGPAAAAELAAIKDAVDQESASLAQLFQPGLFLVLVIGVTLAVLQQVTGINVFLYFAPEIFKSVVKAETHAALLQQVVVGAVMLLFTVVAIWTVDRLGRKPLMLVGFLGMGVCLAGLGLAAYYERKDVWVLTFILGYTASFALSVGPVTWVILAEIFPTRIRGRAMAIATVCLWLANLVVSQTFPMMDKNEWLIARFHHGFPFFVYGLLCLVALAFVAVCVPETKGRSLEEIERQWMRGQ